MNTLPYPLNPWDHAPQIAQHLANPAAELLLVLGAEAWCSKCRRLRPLFDALCEKSMPVHMLSLWLDLEEHAEFLGGFVPPDLPLLLRWHQGQCVQAARVNNIDPEAADPTARVSLQTLELRGQQLVDPHDGTLLPLPQLWGIFAGTDARAGWAQG
jgi:hypothetical protein